MKKATIYDYARMCKACHCDDCPLWVDAKNCDYLIRTNPDKANEIILKWCKEHPIKTRQDRFLKMFPNAPKDENGIIDLCPDCIDTNIECFHSAKKCAKCCKNYWLAEVDENE